jgi:two-component system sensor histidine kinase HydH
MDTRDSVPSARRIASLRIGVVVAGIVGTSLLHYFTPTSLFLWHNIFQRLYLLPIIYAAIYFGWRGGVASSAFAAIAYLPHIFLAWRSSPHYEVNQYAEIIVFFLIGLVTGILADRERRRAEELQRTSEELRKVYQDLQDSFEQLKRADRLSAIGQLSAGLAHEIRNPLSSIEGAANILDQPQTSGELRQEFLGIIKKECRRLNRLLTNLLDFARPRPPAFHVSDLGPLVDSVIALVSHTAEQSNITIRRILPALLPAVEIDAEQIKQVVLNLAINGIQAMPHGGTLEFVVSSTGTSVVLSVKDEGEGISSEDLDPIFDPFFTTKDTGTGLGLSVAHQIVSQHGGAIEAQRNPQKGMTFRVVLPLARRRHA